MEHKKEILKTFSEEEEKNVILDIKTFSFFAIVYRLLGLMFFAMMIITFFLSCFKAFKGEPVLGICVASLINCFFGHIYSNSYKKAIEKVNFLVEALSTSTLIKLNAAKELLSQVNQKESEKR